MTPEERAAVLCEKLRNLGWLNHLYPFVQNSVAGQIAEAIEEEREACAKIAESWEPCSLISADDYHAPIADIAAGIRGRSTASAPSAPASAPPSRPS